MSTKVQIVVEGHDRASKVSALMASLHSQLLPGVTISYLTGCIGDPGPADFQVWHFEGENHFQLRSRLPELVGDCEWVVLLEDHNAIDGDWIPAILDAVDRAHADTQIVVGPLSNKRSTEPWSWASFLVGSGLHWAPRPLVPIPPNRFNCAIRRSIFGSARLEEGEFEFQTLPGMIGQTELAPDMVVDHIQHQTITSALQHHWCNGRAAATLFPGGRPQALMHIKIMGTKRTTVVRDAIRAHPERAQLPPGTNARIFCLCLMHAAGCWWGTTFGTGRAAWELE